MTMIKNELSGYLKIEEDEFAYHISDNIVTLLPVCGDQPERKACLDKLADRKVDSNEFFWGYNYLNQIGIMVSRNIDRGYSYDYVNFCTPLIIQACGNAHAFYSNLTEDLKKFHAITFYGGTINSIMNPGIAINYSSSLKNEGVKAVGLIKPFDNYTLSSEFIFNNEEIMLTVSIRYSSEKGDNINSGNLGRMVSFIRFAFKTAHNVEDVLEFYNLAKKLLSVMVSQKNVHFDEVYLSQRNHEDKFFDTFLCKVFDKYENYSNRNSSQVIPIMNIIDYIPKIIERIHEGQADHLLELLPTNNSMRGFITIKDIPNICTAMEIAYDYDKKKRRKENKSRDKDVKVVELKEKIKEAIKEFTASHEEFNPYNITTINSCFQYLDFTLATKIQTLYEENRSIVDSIANKHGLPLVNDERIEKFVKLRNAKTHAGKQELGDNAYTYLPFFSIVYSCFFKQADIPDEVIENMVYQIL